jgi:hypothetical protein
MAVSGNQRNFDVKNAAESQENSLSSIKMLEND